MSMHKFLSAVVTERSLDVFRAANRDLAATADEAACFDRVYDHLSRYHQLPSVDRAKEMFAFMAPTVGQTAQELREGMIMAKLRTNVAVMNNSLQTLFQPNRLPGRPDQLRDILRACLNEVDKVARPLGTHTLLDAANLVNEYLDRVNRGEVKVIPVGQWPTMNKISGGMLPTNIFTLVGPPKAGKSQLFTDMMLAIWLAGNSVHFCSAELSFEEIAMRIMGIITTISHSSIRHGHVSTWARDRLQTLIDSKLDGRHGFTIQAVDSEGFGGNLSDVEAEVSRLRPDVCGIDAVYLLEPMNFKGKQMWEKFHTLAGDVKRLAVDYKTAVFQSVQFNAEGAADNDWTPNDTKPEPGEDKKKKESRERFGKMHQLAGGQAIIRNTSMLMSVEYGKPGRERSSRVLRLLANRADEIGSIEVNYKIGPTDHSELNVAIPSNDGPEIPFE